jgi:hypothetical protein
LFFEKNANFFRRKLSKIEETYDPNIDPWSPCLEKNLRDVGACCAWSREDESIVSVCSFWLEGVSILAVGLPGLVGNGLSILVLVPI